MVRDRQYVVVVTDRTVRGGDSTGAGDRRRDSGSDSSSDGDRQWR